MSISIGAGYDLPEEKHHRLRSREEDGGVQESERIAVVDDLNDKLQASSSVIFVVGIYSRVSRYDRFAFCQLFAGMEGRSCPPHQRGL